MPTKSPTDLLNELYEQSMGLVASNENITSNLSQPEKDALDKILDASERAKAVLSVLITSLTYKELNPNQDIRNHQESIPNGYSGRTYDAKFVTPFMKSCKFPAMAESGWLTRSLEQKVPYDRNYSGAITPTAIKTSFLDIIENIQNGANCEEYLRYLLQGLIIQRNKQAIDLAKPAALSIGSILEVLDKHFHSSYKAEGASRLPTLAIYAAYQCLIKEAKRFENKKLMPLESHTSSDLRSGRIGDIDIVDEADREFEAVEIKHGINITLQLVQDAYSKFQTTPVSRYYILSTASYDRDEWVKIQEEIQRIKNVHGCQVIINGILPTLKYYLRLLVNPFDFVECYVNLLELDTALKYEHKEMWNRIIGEM